MKIAVPGNLLLLGEYIVTLPGGKGLATAIDCWAQLTIGPASSLSIHSLFEGKRTSWAPGNSLIDAVLTVFETVAPIPSIEVAIDTSDFAYPDGVKKGFGSSAAVAVGLTAALWIFAFRKPPSPHELFPLALRAHRAFQGGRGSGYDVAASLFGGVGLFTGGELPQWQPCPQAAWWDHLFFVRGDTQSSSRDALIRFEQKNQLEIIDLFEKNNVLVKAIIASHSLKQASEILNTAAEMNAELHKFLGMAHEGEKLKKQLDTYRGRGCVAKCLGAGGELALLLCPDSSSNDLPPLRVSSQGLLFQ